MSKLSIFLRKKLFKFQPSPSQSPSEKDTIIIVGKTFLSEIEWAELDSIPDSPSGTPSPSEEWYGPGNPSFSPTVSPPYSYNTPTKKSPLLKKPKRVEDDLIPSQTTRDYKRIIDNEEE